MSKRVIEHHRLTADTAIRHIHDLEAEMEALRADATNMEDAINWAIGYLNCTRVLSSPPDICAHIEEAILKLDEARKGAA